MLNGNKLDMQNIVGRLCGFGLSFAMGRDQTVWLGSSKGEPSRAVEGGWNGIKMEATWC